MVVFAVFWIGSGWIRFFADPDPHFKNPDPSFFVINILTI